MERTHARVSVAAVAAALVLVTPVPSANAAAGHGHGAHGKDAHATTRLAHDITRKNQALLRIAGRIDRLPSYAADAVVANIADDRQALAGATSVSDVRHFRPAVYRWVFRALRKTDRLQRVAASTTDASVSQAEEAAIGNAVAALAGLDARSQKSDVHAARLALRDAVHAVHGTAAAGDGGSRTGRWGE